MSAVLDRARVRKTSTTGLPGLPQVNLLPPEVRAARSLSVVKRWLALSLVVVVALVGIAYVAVAMTRAQAVERLADAEARTVMLRTEERKYAEVTPVLAAIDSVTRGQMAATETEILWLPYLDAVTAVMPEDVRVSSFMLTGPSPTEPSVSAPSVLGKPSIGALTFEASSRTLPDTAAMLDALASVPGLQDPWASSISLTEVDGVVQHSVSLSVQLADATLSQRFVVEEEN